MVIVVTLDLWRMVLINVRTYHYHGEVTSQNCHLQHRCEVAEVGKVVPENKLRNV